MVFEMLAEDSFYIITRNHAMSLMQRTDSLDTPSFLGSGKPFSKRDSSHMAVQIAKSIRVLQTHVSIAILWQRLS